MSAPRYAAVVCAAMSYRDDDEMSFSRYYHDISPAFRRHAYATPFLLLIRYATIKMATRLMMSCDFIMPDAAASAPPRALLPLFRAILRAVYAPIVDAAHISMLPCAA